MPSVLVELGYVSNPEEEKFLMSEQGQDCILPAIYRAFRDYKQTIDTRSGLNANGTVNNEPAVPVKEDSTGRPAAEVKKEETVAPPVPVPPLTEIKPEVVTDDIIFMVQISAMPKNKPMNQSQLTGIEKVTKIEEGERVKYGAGSFSIYEDAVRYRRTLSLGFPDAFVIAVRNGKIIPLNEAIEAKKTKQP
jgi:N-acetylmuramoyl-L-alanine amidase